MFITLYFIVTRLPESLRSVMDHFLSLDPTSLTVDLLEQHLLTVETSAIAVGAACGTPRPPFFEGCSPSPLAPSYASATAADVSVAEDVRAAFASAKHRSNKGKGGRGGGAGSGGGGGGSGSGGGGSSGGSGGSGGGGGSGGSSGGGGGKGGSGGSGGGGTGGSRTGPRHGGSGGGQRQQRRSETQLPQELHLLRSRIAIFDLDFDAILSAMYALSVSAEGDCYRCVPPDPSIAAATLGASESGTLPGTALDQALHAFTLDSSASRCFLRDCTTLTPLPAPVAVRLADPSGGPVFARSSTVLSCPAVPSGSLSGLHLPSFSTNLTLLWHHRLGHPSLPRLHGMHSRLLVSGLPRSLPPLPPSPAPICLPCVEGRQRAAPHSSFPLTSAPLQTLHMDVWGLARVNGQGRERYFLLVVDDYTRYTTVFPLRSKGEVVDVLIPWICIVRLQLRERFGQDLPVLRLHSDRGGEFSSNLLRDFCRGEGILQSFTLPDFPQQNGIAQRRIGLVVEVARTSMIHAAAPHFLWPFAVRYAAHQLNLWPRVSLPETSPTLRWTGEVGVALVFRVWGSRAFVCDTSTDKLSARAIPCVFLGFVPDAPGWQFYHPTLRRVLPSQDVTFDESVPFYCLFPYRSAPPPPSPLFLAPVPPLVDRLLPHGPAPSGMSQVDPLPGTAPVEVVVGSGAALGVASRGDASGGAEPGGAGVLSLGVLHCLEVLLVLRGDCLRSSCVSGLFGAHAFGVELPELETLLTLELEVLELLLGTGGTAAPSPGGARTRGAGAAGTGGVGVAGAGDPMEPGAAGDGGSCSGGAGTGGAGAGGAGVGGTGTGGIGAGGARAVDPGVGGAGDPVRPRLYFVPLLQQVPDPESDRARAASATVSRLLATSVTDPSFESAAASALVAELLDFAAACRLDYATALVAESASACAPSVRGECALGRDILEDRQKDFECLAAAVPRLASMLLASEGDPDAPDIPTPLSYAEAITGTYVDEVPPPRANIVDGMRIFRVKRPPGSLPSFKVRYIARGFSQRQGVDYFQTFSPIPKMTTLRVLLHVAVQRDYELHSLDFSTAFLQGSLHQEIWLRRPPGFIESFPAGTQWSLRRPVYGVHQAPRKSHDTLRTTLAALGFSPATADPSLFLRIDTSLQPFYVLDYIDDLVFATADIEALTLITRDRARRTITLTQSHMVHQSIEPNGPYPKLVGCLITSGMGLVLGGGGPVVLTGHADASWVDDLATQRSSQGSTFSLGSGSVSWRSTCSSSVLSSSCEVEIYGGAMAAQELRWLTYLLTDLGEQPRLPPIPYVDNKAMIALCQEHRLEN
ncbi:unnamed protein product [Closterium sp. NIES-53]